MRVFFLFLFWVLSWGSSVCRQGSQVCWEDRCFNAPAPADDPEGLPFEARRIFMAIRYGIPPSGVYGGDEGTLPVLWSLHYDCGALRKAIHYLAPCADRFNVTLECASEVNAQRLQEYVQWNASYVPRRGFLEMYSGETREADMPAALRDCWSYGESCYISGGCRGCLRHSTTLVHFVTPHGQ